MVVTSVYSANPLITQGTLSGVKDEAESARNKLRKLLLEGFKEVAKPGTEYCGQFRVLETINCVNRVAYLNEVSPLLAPRMTSAFS
jgi:hypothetical protein